MEMNHAGAARELVSRSSAGVLATHSLKKPGYPAGSVMPYALDGQGWPVFLISRLAQHTQNLMADARATLLVTGNDGPDALSGPRVSLFGDVTPVKPEESESLKRLYLEAHPEASQWADFGDFGLFQMDVKDVYYIGGFGEMGWVGGAMYRNPV